MTVFFKRLLSATPNLDNVGNNMPFFIMLVRNLLNFHVLWKAGGYDNYTEEHATVTLLFAFSATT